MHTSPLPPSSSLAFQALHCLAARMRLRQMPVMSPSHPLTFYWLSRWRIQMLRNLLNACFFRDVPCTSPGGRRAPSQPWIESGLLRYRESHGSACSIRFSNLVVRYTGPSTCPNPQQLPGSIDRVMYAYSLFQLSLGLQSTLVEHCKGKAWSPALP